MTTVNIFGTDIEIGWFIVLLFIFLYLIYVIIATIYSCLTCQTARRCIRCYCCPFTACYRMLCYACTGERPMRENVYRSVSTEDEDLIDRYA